MTRDEFDQLRIGAKLQDNRGRAWMLVGIRPKDQVRVLVLLGRGDPPETKYVRLSASVETWNNGI